MTTFVCSSILDMRDLLYCKYLLMQDSRFLGRGSSNGSFKGHKYFECGTNCGLFVSLDKLAPKAPSQGNDHSKFYREVVPFHKHIASVYQSQ